MSDLLTPDDIFNADIKNQDEEESVEGLFDLIIPPGVSQDIIMELIEEFNLEPVDRTVNVSIAETDPRDLLALRGDLESVNAAHDYMLKLLKEQVGE